MTTTQFYKGFESSIVNANIWKTSSIKMNKYHWSIQTFTFLMLNKLKFKIMPENIYLLGRINVQKYRNSTNRTVSIFIEL